MKDLSIEYCHIYSNNHINEEHAFSVEILRKITKEELGSVSFITMVDDYSFPDPSFDYEALWTWLTGQGFKPDAIIRESQLIPACDEVLKLVNDETLKSQIGDYVRAKKYPCSLFIAAWYLLRLGAISNPLVGEGLVAKRLINILPISFKPFEDKAFELIKSTPFADKVNDIENKYFEGRLMA